LGQGDAVTVVSVHQELTTQEAADVLNVSRPYVCKLLDDGVLPSRKVNTHRRVRLADVLAHKAQQAAVAETAMAELQAQAQELDLGY
jgi:excisionase family DNA binding protein